MSSIQEYAFRILITSDDQTYRNALANRLRIDGHAVEFANGGFHLCHMLEKYQTQNLLIIHENQFDMPAHEIISLVRVNFNKHDLPILFITKSKSDEDIKDIISSGGNEYIIQASNFANVLDKVKKYHSLINKAS